MNKIIIAASVLGTAAAGVYWYMKNRNRADEALTEVKDAARNAYHRMNKRAKAVSSRANDTVQEALA